MRQIILGLLIAVYSITFLMSCSTDQDLAESTEREASLRKVVSLSDIPFLEQELTNRKALAHRGKQDYYSLVLPERILEQTNADNSKTYTFALDLVKQDTLTNLVMTVKDNEFKSYLMEYISEDLENWINDITNTGSSQFDVQMRPVDLDEKAEVCMSLSYTCPSGMHVHDEYSTCRYKNMNLWELTINIYECPTNGGGSSGVFLPGHGGTGTIPGIDNPGGIFPGSGTFPNPPTKATSIDRFYSGLNNSQLDWFSNQSDVFKNTILDYVKTQLDGEFAYEILDLCMQEANPSDNFNLTNLVIKLNGNQERLFDESFIQSLDTYIDLDFSYPPSTFNPNFISIKIYLDYRRLRQLNPEWKKSKCLWYASKEIIHLSLDAFGLIPVGGEIADLANGVLYTIEGDGINATLSYASAIPIVGYGATTTKYGLKIINSSAVYTIATKVKLVWKVTADGVTFGNRNQLRKVLGLVVGDLKQAHHLIPWDFCNSPLVQKAAKSSNAFHMNEVMNGIPLPTTNHLTGHNLYNQKIQQKLSALNSVSPTPEIAYQNLSNLISQIRTIIQNNPTMNLGQIASLIN